jgi:hypothetical protein
MRRLADALEIEVDDRQLAALAQAATFEAMRANSRQLAPDTGRILKSRTAFFRRGSSGAGVELLEERDWVRYEQRARELAPEDLLVWLHRRR